MTSQTSAQALPTPIEALPMIRRAAEVIGPHIVRTPTVPAPAFSELSGHEVFLKLETLQRTGAFKVRGALNKILTLDPESRSRGVVAASAGNHAQGVALASKIVGCPATIVMPERTPVIKVGRTQSHGPHVTIVLHGANYDEAYDHARTLASERGAVMVHPFDDLDVICGQGTIGLELFEQAEPLDTVIVPIGGGGLIAGIGLALKALWPKVKLVGVQAEGAAPMVRSFEADSEVVVAGPKTIADGIQVGKVGRITWPLVRAVVDQCITVSEDEITDAMVQALEQTKLVTEGAGATALAGLLSGRAELGPRVGLLMCGGNIDLTLLTRVIESGLAKAGRYHRIRLRTADVPGVLQRITSVLTQLQTNIVDISHQRQGWKVPVGSVDVEILVEVRDGDQGPLVDEALRAAGFAPREH
ncbi:threonine ammonia-lyase [Engelhardtia mirabilis]|uniref:L-threonine dehydratase catabolic TdcB n=1 Tax=Engelhardtia mirabilis TaxID=2528011 RepID=A0A518BNQ6_9BACT|nr:L-threonine dehydratase catabolic TdcB [Planctomycetes bacterium Pla133]QDV02922.1 L-threonine dehydratase catabolic TdcB [Planctomycetes bacterium Pla86]